MERMRIGSKALNVTKLNGLVGRRANRDEKGAARPLQKRALTCYASLVDIYFYGQWINVRGVPAGGALWRRGRYDWALRSNSYKHKKYYFLSNGYEMTMKINNTIKNIKEFFG